MKALFDTHILLWAATGSERLSSRARELLMSPVAPVFSAVSIWEIAIKSGLGHAGFTVDPKHFRRELLRAGYVELPLTGNHAASVVELPQVHTDPFDRALVAQARAEGLTLVTSDATVARYGDSVELV
ncbi:type II toxin-antitoxin system VapC family toxin [Actinomycetes bacterium M1A6_2h]